MGRNTLLYVVVCTMTLFACNGHHRLVGKRDLLKYINDPGHGLVKENEVNDIKVKLSFEPSSLMIAQEILALGKRDSGTIHQLEDKYNKSYYFQLKFSKNNKEAIRQLGGFSQYSDMVQVLSFQMGQFINLTTVAKDTIPLADYSFVQTYGMSDGNTLILAFAKDKIEHSDNLDVNLGECGFEIGSMKFSFRRSDLEDVPQLDYNKLN